MPAFAEQISRTRSDRTRPVRVFVSVEFHRRFEFQKRSQLFLRVHKKRFPSPRCASAIQIVRPSESIAWHLLNVLCSAERNISNYFWKIGRNKSKVFVNRRLADAAGYVRIHPSRHMSAKQMYPMKKLFFVLAMLSLVLVMADAAEQDTVNRCTAIIGEFRQMPEKAIPRDVLSHARGLAIISVFKAGFIFSGKGGQGVVVARTPHGWSGPSFIATGGAGWGLQAGAQVTDFVIVLNNSAAVQAFSRGGNVTIGADVSAAAGPVGRTAGGAVTPTAAVYTYSKSIRLFCWCVVGRRSGRNATGIQFPLLWPTR